MLGLNIFKTLEKRMSKLKNMTKNNLLGKEGVQGGMQKLNKNYSIKNFFHEVFKKFMNSYIIMYSIEMFFDFWSPNINNLIFKLIWKETIVETQWELDDWFSISKIILDLKKKCSPLFYQIMNQSEQKEWALVKIYFNFKSQNFF